MLISRKNRRRRNQGFTLIELMIVIAIIGVLAAVAVPNFTAARKKANMKACRANQKTIAGAVTMYNLDENLSVDTIPWDELLEGGYLSAIPGDPGQGGVESAKENYQMLGENGAGVACKVHGDAYGNSFAEASSAATATS